MAKKRTGELAGDISLKYQGENGYPFINGIPARDLEHTELINLAEKFNMGFDEFVGLLCSRGLYSMVNQFVQLEQSVEEEFDNG